MNGNHVIRKVPPFTSTTRPAILNFPKRPLIISAPPAKPNPSPGATDDDDDDDVVCLDAPIPRSADTAAGDAPPASSRPPTTPQPSSTTTTTTQIRPTVTRILPSSGLHTAGIATAAAAASSSSVALTTTSTTTKTTGLFRPGEKRLGSTAVYRPVLPPGAVLPASAAGNVRLPFDRRRIFTNERDSHLERRCRNLTEEKDKIRGDYEECKKSNEFLTAKVSQLEKTIKGLQTEIVLLKQQIQQQPPPIQYPHPLIRPARGRGRPPKSSYMIPSNSYTHQAIRNQIANATTNAPSTSGGASGVLTRSTGVTVSGGSSSGPPPSANTVKPMSTLKALLDSAANANNGAVLRGSPDSAGRSSARITPLAGTTLASSASAVPSIIGRDHLISRPRVSSPPILMKRSRGRPRLVPRPNPYMIPKPQRFVSMPQRPSLPQPRTTGDANWVPNDLIKFMTDFIGSDAAAANDDGRDDEDYGNLSATELLLRATEEAVGAEEAAHKEFSAEKEEDDYVTLDTDDDEEEEPQSTGETIKLSDDERNANDGGDAEEAQASNEMEVVHDEAPDSFSGSGDGDDDVQMGDPEPGEEGAALQEKSADEQEEHEQGALHEGDDADQEEEMVTFSEEQHEEPEIHEISSDGE